MNTFTVSEMFGDHMVLCHSRENPVWGTAAPGAVVQIRLGEYSAETVAGPDGRWRTQIQTPGAGEITEMALRCGQEEIVFRDVACGEVWLAGGQSNMEMPVLAVHGAKEMARAESYPNVRLRTIPRRCRAEKQFGWHFQPMDGTDSGWLLPSEQTVAKFSAIGYGFAAGLAEKMRMPVGIIDMSWGGTVIQAWMPQEELLAHDDTRRDVERFQARRAALGEEAERSFLRNQASLRAVLERTPDFVERSLEDMQYYTRLEREIDWPPEAAVGDPNEPGSLFAHMVAATAPYGIRGVLWYQGESNALVGEAGRYAGLFARMRESWQQAWGRPLPFLTCQLATFDPFIWGGGYDWVTLREQQAHGGRLHGSTGRRGRGEGYPSPREAGGGPAAAGSGGAGRVRRARVGRIPAGAGGLHPAGGRAAGHLHRAGGAASRRRRAEDFDRPGAQALRSNACG